MMSFSVSAIFPASPVHSPGRRTEKSPFLKATRALSSSLVFKESVDRACLRIGVLPKFDQYPERGFKAVRVRDKAIGRCLQTQFETVRVMVLGDVGDAA